MSEYWVLKADVENGDICTDEPEFSELFIRTVDRSDYDHERKRADLAEKSADAAHGDAMCARAERDDALKALEKITNGIPEEWYLAQVKKERDQALAENEKLRADAQDLYTKYIERGMAMMHTGDMVRSLYAPKNVKLNEENAKLRKALTELHNQADSVSRSASIAKPYIRAITERALADKGESHAKTDEN